MRILWHSAAPWEGTGYGQQTSIWTRRFRDAGHTVALSVYHGVQGHVAEWDGLKVYPAPLARAAVPDTLRGHMDAFKPDLVVCLGDFFDGLPPMTFEGYKTAAWIPVDVTRPAWAPEAAALSLGDSRFLREGDVIPVAMSLHGHKALQTVNRDALYVPHGIDTRDIFYPPSEEERTNLRWEYGIPDGWIAVGMNASVVDPWRKAYGEQLAAFARFHGKHPQSLLFIHGLARWEGGLDVWMLAQRGAGLDHTAVRLADQYRVQTGGYTPSDVARFYAAMDVVMNATEGEGFGLPGLEAQACGTPVILSHNSTGPELAGIDTLLVPCQPRWDPAHGAWRATPLVNGLVAALEKAAKPNPFRRQAARLHAEKWDIEKVWPMWETALSELEKL